MSLYKCILIITQDWLIDWLNLSAGNNVNGRLCVLWQRLVESIASWKHSVLVVPVTVMWSSSNQRRSVVCESVDVSTPTVLPTISVTRSAVRLMSSTTSVASAPARRSVTSPYRTVNSSVPDRVQTNSPCISKHHTHVSQVSGHLWALFTTASRVG